MLREIDIIAGRPGLALSAMVDVKARAFDGRHKANEKAELEIVASRHSGRCCPTLSRREE